MLARLLKVNDQHIENDWKKLASTIMADPKFICDHKSDKPDVFWSRALKTFSMTPAIQQMIKKAMVVGHSSADAERTFSIINGIRNNNRHNLIPSTVDHLVRIKMNGPSLNSFNPQKYSEAWQREGHRLSDSISPPKKEKRRDGEQPYESLIY